jgi:hypothetical protein
MKYQSASYIYNINYYYKIIDVWAGFTLPDTSIEWLPQFVGEIETINTDSGGESQANARINARDLIYRKLTSTVIGRPASDGTPQPYMSGKRYRVPCKETDETNFIYTFYCQQTITSIDAVYVRDTSGQKWVTAPSNSTSAVNKTVDFASDPEAEVAVDITVNTVDHPCDIILAIIEDELALDSDQYNSTLLATIKTRLSGLSVGVGFDNIKVYDALQQLVKAIDGAIFVEGGVLQVVNYWPTLTTTQSISKSEHSFVSVLDSIAEVQNKVSVFYGDYDDDKTSYIEISDSNSVTDYGELTKDKFDFRYTAPVSITSSIYITSILGHWLYRQQYQYEQFNVMTRLELLRMEIFDIIKLSDTAHNITDAHILILSQQLDLTEFSGQFSGIRFPEVEWLYWSDDDETLSYFVDDSDSDLAYQSYFW